MNTQTKPAPPKVVIAPEGCRDYFTVGKEYEVIQTDDFDSEYGHGFTIINDKGNICYCLEIECLHIYNQNWIIAEREVSHD